MRIFTTSWVLALGLALASGAFADSTRQTASAGALLRAESSSHMARDMGNRAGDRRAARLARIAADPALSVIANLRGLERVYLRSNRAGEIPALYRDLLKRTDNLTVRNFASFRLATAASTMARSAAPNFSFSKMRSVGVSNVDLSSSDSTDSSSPSWVACSPNKTGRELLLSVVVFPSKRQVVLGDMKVKHAGGKPAQEWGRVLGTNSCTSCCN